MEKILGLGECFHTLPINSCPIYLAFPAAYAYVCRK